jgi:hypothetical protein
LDGADGAFALALPIGTLAGHSRLHVIRRDLRDHAVSNASAVQQAVLNPSLSRLALRFGPRL